MTKICFMLTSNSGIGTTTIFATHAKRNIDDLLDQKVKWLEVNAKKRRQFKFMLAFVPVAFVLLALYVYSMQIFNMINQVVLVDF